MHKYYEPISLDSFCIFSSPWKFSYSLEKLWRRIGKILLISTQRKDNQILFSLNEKSFSCGKQTTMEKSLSTIYFCIFFRYNARDSVILFIFLMNKYQFITHKRNFMLEVRTAYCSIKFVYNVCALFAYQEIKYKAWIDF